MCSNGIDGVESEDGDYCCPASCGVCDGDDCAADGEGCCGDVIEESGVMCDDSEVAPCIIDGTSSGSKLDLVSPSLLRKAESFTYSRVME